MLNFLSRRNVLLACAVAAAAALTAGALIAGGAGTRAPVTPAPAEVVR